MSPTILHVREYLTASGDSPFGAWFDALDPQAAAKVSVALSRLARGAHSNVKGVGSGVLEFRLDYGPGYRIYFGKDGETIVILLAGGTKQRQQRDVEDARVRWREYKDRKTGEG